MTARARSCTRCGKTMRRKERPGWDRHARYECRECESETICSDNSNAIGIHCPFCGAWGTLQRVANAKPDSARDCCRACVVIINDDERRLVEAGAPKLFPDVGHYLSVEPDMQDESGVVMTWRVVDIHPPRPRQLARVYVRDGQPVFNFISHRS